MRCGATDSEPSLENPAGAHNMIVEAAGQDRPLPAECGGHLGHARPLRVEAIQRQFRLPLRAVDVRDRFRPNLFSGHHWEAAVFRGVAQAETGGRIGSARAGAGDVAHRVEQRARVDKASEHIRARRSGRGTVEHAQRPISTRSSRPLAGPPRRPCG